MDSSNQEPADGTSPGLVQDMGIGEPQKVYKHLTKDELTYYRQQAAFGIMSDRTSNFMLTLLNEIEELTIERDEAQAQVQTKSDPTKIFVSRAAVFRCLQLLAYNNADCVRTLITEYNSQLNLAPIHETPTS